MITIVCDVISLQFIVDVKFVNILNEHDTNNH